MNWLKVFTYIFEDKNWAKKMLVGSLIIAVQSPNLYPAVYQMRVIENFKVGAPQPLPAEVKGRSDIIYLDGDDPNLDPKNRRVQTPRVFYRREPETNPLVLTKP